MMSRCVGALCLGVLVYWPRRWLPTLAKQPARRCWSCVSVFMAACQNLQSLKNLPATHCVCALAAVVFANPGAYAGRILPVVRECVSWPQAAQILTEVTGVQVRRACIYYTACYIQYDLVVGNAHQLMVPVPMQGQCMVVMARPV